MKKLGIISLLVLAAFVFTGCGDEKDRDRDTNYGYGYGGQYGQNNGWQNQQYNQCDQNYYISNDGRCFDRSNREVDSNACNCHRQQNFNGGNYNNGQGNYQNWNGSYQNGGGFQFGGGFYGGANGHIGYGSTCQVGAGQCNCVSQYGGTIGYCQ